MDTIINITQDNAIKPAIREVMDMVAIMVHDHPDRQTIAKEFGAFCFTNAWENDQAPQWFLDMHSAISDVYQDTNRLAITEWLLRGLIATLIMTED